jgi:hypothetical protein
MLVLRVAFRVANSGELPHNLFALVHGIVAWHAWRVDMVLSSRRNEEFYRELAIEMRSRIPAIAPNWTEPIHSDPGIAVLQLFAFITERMLKRPDEPSPSGSAMAHRLAVAARALEARGAPEKSCGVRRVNYFAGQLLDSRDFVDEQDYVRQRLRRRNRLLHGTGIVTGLGVSVAADAGGQDQIVVVKPGFALDPRGEELEICSPITVPIPGHAKTLLVQLLFSERPAAEAPAAANPASGPDGQFTRVEESADLLLAPAQREDTVSLARLIFKSGKWRVDRTFKPKRARNRVIAEPG